MSSSAVAGGEFQQALAFHKQGRLAEAEPLYRAVLAREPRHPGALHFLGMLEMQKGAPDLAVTLIAQAIAIDPNVADAYSNLGLALQALKRPAEALANYDRALQLKADHVQALSNRGNALQDLMRPAEALGSYDRALQINPGFALAWNNRGNALLALGQTAEALASYERALQALPDYPDALDNRGRVLRDLKRFDEAAKSFERLLAIRPDSAYGPGMLFDTRLHACDWTDYEATRQRIEAGIARGEPQDAPFSFLSHSRSPALQLRCAQLFVARQHQAAEPLAAGVRYDHQRIRIAYLSADFHDHATAYLMAELFERHDRARFEIVGVSFGPDDAGRVRARLKAAFDEFIDVRGKTDREVAAWMYEREIDIAVDLKGYTAGNRAGIFAHRGAPLQVAYLGYPGTMGASFIDYVIADRHVVPAGHEPFYREKVVHLPNTYQVTDSTRRIAPDTPSRLALGLPENGFVFCSFNNNYKIRPPVFDAWMRLLRDAPGSVLWLLQDNVVAAANLRREAEQRGISAARLVFAPRVPLDEHLARHRQADLFVDTFPYNAHTTASDALWAGLPLVTCAGETFASRVGLSLLNAIGLPELVTSSLEDYERLCRRLATTPAALAETKAKLARNRLDAPLFDSDGFRRALEAAFTTMHARHRQGASPAGFEVTI